MIERSAVPEPVLRFLDAWRDGDPVARASVLAEGFALSDPTGRIEGDLSGAQAQFVRETESWGDRNYELTHLVGSGEHLAIGYRYTMTGRAGADSGVIVHLPITAFIQLAGNRISTWRALFDTAVFARARKSAGIRRDTTRQGVA